jgi:hypothetical protein
MHLMGSGQSFYDCEPVDTCCISVRMNCMLQKSVKAAGWDEASLLLLKQQSKQDRSCCASICDATTVAPVDVPANSTSSSRCCRRKCSENVDRRMENVDLSFKVTSST